LSGKRVTIGNNSGISGLNLGEDLGQRAFILWQNQQDYLELGTRSGRHTYSDTLVLRNGKVGVGEADPTESLTVDGLVLADAFVRRSSEQWKTNIQTIEGALEKVQGLRGISYDWKGDGKHDIGLIAEEVSKVIPEAVACTENGREATGVDYARLVPVLIEAVKEQQQLLEEQDVQIAALQEHNREVEARIAALEAALGVEAKEGQTGLSPVNNRVMWIMASGVGLMLGASGLALGYRRIRRDE
jgi:hypothetical protein